MIRSVLSLVRGDIERQTAWVAGEVKRQGAHSAATAAFALLALVSFIGAAAVGCIALYTWVAASHGTLWGLAAVGGALALVAAIFAAVAASRKPSLPLPRPVIQSTDAAALKQAMTSDLSGTADQALSLVKASPVGPAVTAAEDILKSGTALYRAASGQLRGASKTTAFGTLVVAGVLGMVLGRRL